MPAITKEEWTSELFALLWRDERYREQQTNFIKKVTAVIERAYSTGFDDATKKKPAAANEAIYNILKTQPG